MTEEQKEKKIICKIVIQQCVNASLRFDTEDSPVSISRGMVVFVCFLQEATIDCIEKIAKSIVNINLCETDESTKRFSVLESKQDVLIIPQATLGGKLRGKNFQYHGLVSKSLGAELFQKLVENCKSQIEGNVQSGIYGARQILKMETNGPYTHVLEF